MATGSRTTALTRRALFLAGAPAAGLLLMACDTTGRETAAPAARSAALSGKIQVLYRSDSRTRAVYTPITEAFQKRQPALTVEVLDLGSSDYQTALFALFVAGTPPDAFWLSLDRFGSYVNKNLLLNIDQYARRDAKEAQLDDIFPGLLNQGRYKNGLYGLTADGGGPVLFWNTGLVEQTLGRGQDPGSLNDAGKWTLEAYIDAGKRLTRRDSTIANSVWGSHDPLYHNSSRLPWLWGMGGDLYNRDLTAIVVDQPTGIEHLQWLLDTIVRHGFVPSTDELNQVKAHGQTDQRSMFYEGRVAMMTQWTTTVGMPNFNAAQEKGLRWDATLLPSGRSGQLSCAWFHEFCIPAQTKHPEAAWQALAHYASPASTLAKALGGSTFPYRRSTATAPEYLKGLPPQYVKIHAKHGEQLRPYPLITEDTEMAKILSEEYTALREGKKAPRDVAQAIKQRGEPLLKSS